MDKSLIYVVVANLRNGKMLKYDFSFRRLSVTNGDYFLERIFVCSKFGNADHLVIVCKSNTALH
jgi:hypothetical protein